jgi:hypothetical protein
MIQAHGARPGSAIHRLALDGALLWSGVVTMANVTSTSHVQPSALIQQRIRYVYRRLQAAPLPWALNAAGGGGVCGKSIPQG